MQNCFVFILCSVIGLNISRLLLRRHRLTNCSKVVTISRNLTNPVLLDYISYELRKK